jgi:excisionase family DNA binding protein
VWITPRPPFAILHAFNLEDRMSKFLYRTSEAKAALGVGTTTLYSLINSGRLEARRLGKRTYITAESLEAFIASLPVVETPTMARAKHTRWSVQRRRPKPQEDDPGAIE